MFILSRQDLRIRAASAAYAVAMETAVRAVLFPGLRALGRSDEAFQRFGRAVLPQKRHARRLLVHAVSAGEMSAAAAFVDAVLTGDAGAEVILSTGTRDGLHAAKDIQDRHARVVGSVFLPWDRPRAMHAWLAGAGTDAVAIVETEIWPGLFEACRTLEIPLLLVSARIYPRDVPRYSALGRIWTRVLSAPALTLVQDAHERGVFLRLGAPPDRVRIGGNLKFDAARTPAAHGFAGLQPVVVGASTHDPEESVLLDAVTWLRGRGVDVQLVLAPRRIARASQVRHAAAGRGLDVTVIDRMGALPDAYDRASVVFIGGTLAKRGGHNIIEPASRGLPCIVGPHADHIRGNIDGLEACGGVRRVPITAVDRPAILAEAIAELLADRGGMGEAAHAWCRGQRGAASTAAEALSALWLEGRSARCN